MSKNFLVSLGSSGNKFGWRFLALFYYSYKLFQSRISMMMWSGSVADRTNNWPPLASSCCSRVRVFTSRGGGTYSPGADLHSVQIHRAPATMTADDGALLAHHGRWPSSDTDASEECAAVDTNALAIVVGGVSDSRKGHTQRKNSHVGKKNAQM